MNFDANHSFNRRSFLKTSAIVGVSWTQLFRNPLTETEIHRQQPLQRLNPSRELSIGLIGVSRNAGDIVNIVPDIPGIRLAAFAMAGREDLGGYQTLELKAMQAIHNMPRQAHLYDSYREMLEKEQLDIVACCLPGGLNAEASIAAARRNCHVIAQNPLATNVRTLAVLESVLDQTRVHLTTMLDPRLSSAIFAMRQAIENGLIGEPVLALAKPSFKSQTPSTQDHQDVLGTTAWFECISYATGLRTTQASALNSSSTRSKKNPSAILLRLSNGATGVVSLPDLNIPIDASYGHDHFRIAGTHGIVELIGGRVMLTTHSSPSTELPLPPARHVIESFVTFLRGQGSPFMTSEESIRLARVALIARQAAREGRVILA